MAAERKLTYAPVVDTAAVVPKGGAGAVREEKAPPPARLRPQIVGIACPDKEGQEKWCSTRSLLNVPCPYRAAIISPPNGGKTSLIKNLIIHADPPYNHIMLRACVPGSQEYSDCNADSLEVVPPMSKLANDLKKMLIIEDAAIRAFPKQERENIEQLLKYGSSHNGITAIIACQSLTDIPVNLRRCISLYILFKPNNASDIDIIAKQVGEQPSALRKLMERHLTAQWDSLWFYTGSQPESGRVFKNGCTVLSQ